MNDNSIPIGQIAVVDDTEANLHLLSNLLDNAGYDVRPFPRGAIAFKGITYSPPDLILLDIKMPEMNGYELCERLKANESTKNIPVIFISALNETFDKVKAFQVGGVDYIGKPFQEQEVLARVATHIELYQIKKKLQATNISQAQQLAEQNRQLLELNESLEEKVKERTRELETTQKQLIESEKMAALGSLVAGVAHEISTPVGNSITVASTLADETKEIVNAVAQGQIKRSTFNEYVDLAEESTPLLLSNLSRAGQLIQSFKQVAVDQSNIELRSFALKEYLEEFILSLAPQLKSTPHNLIVEGDDNLIIESYPGALAQIATNLVTNSLSHGYSGGEAGKLYFDIRRQGDKAHIEYGDDGCGVEPNNLPKIFEPFYTTARHRGGTGLGLHIVYNLVNQKLQGRIEVESKVGVGTKFSITLPLENLM